MKKINPKQVSDIRLRGKMKCAMWVYYPATNGIFGYFKKPACVQNWLGGSEQDVETFLAKKPKLFIENNTVYYQPHVEVYLISGKCIEVFFDTLEEMEQWAEKEFESFINVD